jgi:dTDP-4-amino-4,6-dideoxygalactose transaminase
MARSTEAAARRPIKIWDLESQFEEEKDELMPAVTAILKRGDFIGGDAIGELEAGLAKRIGVAHAVALNSGTDALFLALRVLGIGPGDEVITPPNSFVASTATIVQVGATPVFVDVREDQNIDPALVEAAITPRTRAIMVVHMSGRIAPMNEINDLAKRHGLKVIEDAAQACGSTYHGKVAGSIGDIGCFSAHPLKNMNACGDAGYMTLNDAGMAARARLLRNHGLVDRNTVQEWGVNSRLDTLQAAVLKIRLKNLDSVVERKRANVALYRSLLSEKHVFIPPCQNYEFNTFVLFVVQVDRRDELQKFLSSRGIGTAIHYPIPIHLQPAAAALGHKPGDFPMVERQADRILSLPVHPYMSEDDVRTVAATINEFYGACSPWYFDSA